jgi:hypothetical protein
MLFLSGHLSPRVMSILYYSGGLQFALETSVVSENLVSLFKCPFSTFSPHMSTVALREEFESPAAPFCLV